MLTRALLTDFLFMVFTDQIVNLLFFHREFSHRECGWYFPQWVNYVVIL